jgi:carboxymethylenebutenolidase
VQLTISTSNGLIDGYLAVPSVEVSGEGPWPGVVIVHDVLGLGDDVRQIAGRFASAGYVAIVPNMYARGGAVRCVRGIFKALGEGRGQGFDDIEAARN